MTDMRSPRRRGCSTLARLIAGVGAPSCIWLLSLTTACTADRSPVETAQIAVRANPALELVATDDRQGVLTVRVKRSGQILTVRAADVTAGTAFRDLDTTAAGSPATTAPAAPTSLSVDASRAGVEVSSGDRRVAVQQTPGGVTVERGGTTSRGGAAGGNSSARVAVRQAPGSVAVDAGSAAAPGGSVAVGTNAAGGVSVSTPTGQVTIGALQESNRPATGRPARPAPTEDRQAASSQTTQAGAHIDESRLERQTRRVVCVGNDNTTLDGVLLRVEDGAAIQISGNCRVTIRNSHVAANIAMQVSGNGEVTIDNSIIDGTLQLVGESVTSVQSSTIRGGVQKVQNGKLRDLGNNLWPR